MSVGCALAVALVAGPVAPVHSAATGVLVMSYMFQGYATNGPASDFSGRGHHASVLRSGGGIRSVTRANGQAAAFPAPCSPSWDRACPRAILQTPSHSDLNPGTRPFRYGALVALRPAETSRGSNVVQKGYYTSVGQWKLQVDGLGGRPSCVLGASGRGYKTTAALSVADGAWHHIECSRVGQDLAITVDGSLRGRVRLPVNMSIANGEPVRIGGRSVAQDNDQFFGSVDNVYLIVG